MIFYLPLDESAGTLIYDLAPYSAYHQQILSVENISLGIINLSLDKNGNALIKQAFWSWEDKTIMEPFPIPGFRRVNENNPSYSEDMILKVESETELSLGKLILQDIITISFWIKVIPFAGSELNTLKLIENSFMGKVTMNIATDIEVNTKVLTLKYLSLVSVIKNLSSVNIELDENGWHFYSFSGNKPNRCWSLLSNKYGTDYNFDESSSIYIGDSGNLAYREWRLFGTGYTYLTHIKIYNKYFTPGYIFYHKDNVVNIPATKGLIGYWKLVLNYNRNSIDNLMATQSIELFEGAKGGVYWDSRYKKHDLLEIGGIKYENLIGNIEDYTYALEPDSNYSIPITKKPIIEHIWISFFYKTIEPSTELEIEFPGQFELYLDENSILFTKIIKEDLTKFTLNLDYSIGFNSWTHFLFGLDYSDRANVAMKYQIIQCSTSLIQATEDKTIAKEYYLFYHVQDIQIKVKNHAASLTHFTLWNQTISDMPNYYRYYIY